MKNVFSKKLFEQMPVIGILRKFKLSQVRDVVPYFEKAGFTTVEVTMDTPEVDSIIQYLIQNHPTLNVGAGTICNMQDLSKAIEWGASFIVTPILDEKVITSCVDQNIPIFPGVYTPTEIYRATQLGATAVKLFPAASLGPNFIKDILGPLGQAKILPTGGVNKKNIVDYFIAGAVGVGMGGSLFDSRLIEDRDYEALNAHFREIVEIVRTCKSN